MILYLHGFRSSPDSYKARVMLAHMAKLGRSEEIACPDLSPSPALAIQQAEALLAGHQAEDICIIGSSLGGYYATWLAEKYGCKAILLNPAVKPPRDLESYVGVTTYYHSDRVFEFKAEYMAELRALAVEQISQPERYFLIAATGDEVLDWREMVAHYPQARQFVIEGSDHGIAEFADYLDQVMDFADGRA
ncbi:hypothetical protein UNDYM_4507 [Undibacterium sp. YM2]|uniref:YqiA/YcfP family alpha/beta fold hydrolase n=1 Tax=Undibacterium sp. YM2 TaxID=2058625 RepID=UPI001331DEFF|nr:YqiA/YcfP family alpha/beta fold hydrolase [Undibacterium sp. YM2]BBB68760.1 hypothetical protein UNDYM_4507 [Undibacterium sp. YM2]